MSSDRQPLGKKTLFFYSLTDMPVNMSIFPVLVFIPKFYTSDLGVSLALGATIILAVRIFDVVTDPLCGLISDRVSTPWGRRRVWLVAATPIMMMSVYQLFLPPAGAGALHMAIWMFALSIAMTMTIIPYYAWAAELSPDYHERSRITGWRSMAGVVGSLTAQVAPVLAGIYFAMTGSAAVLQVVGVTLVLLMPICVFLTVTQVPERGEYVKATTPLLEGLKLMATNWPFLRLIIAFMLSHTGIAISTPLYLFFITFVLGAEDKAIYILSVFYATNLAAVPFWVWLSGKVGKHKAYVGSFVLISLAHPFYLLLGQGDIWYMLPVTVITGFAAGGFAALPHSMKADVIDLDRLRTGENRAALFFSTYSFTAKLSASLGGSMALYGLALVGFDTTPGVLNDADQLLGLRLMFAVLPSVFFLLACTLVWNYPITAKVQAELRAQLAKTEGTANTANSQLA